MAKKEKNLDPKKLAVKIFNDSSVMAALPNPDDLIKNSPKKFKIFDEMLNDARIASLFSDRKNATQNLALQLSEVENTAVNEYATKYLTEKSLRKWSNYLLKGALKYGFQPAEIIWAKDDDGYYYIDNLMGHDINKYSFDNDGNAYYTSNGKQLLDDPFKWIIHRTEGDRYNTPYGEAYLKTVYWAYNFKKLGWSYWLTACEKFAVPSIIALFEQSDPKKASEVAAELAEIISSINSGSSGAVANVQGIQQLTMTGSVADFDTLITACDLQIAYGMTGQALATNISDTGTQALGTVQERTKAAGYENDARALAYTLQTLIDMAIEVNFGKDEESPMFGYDTGEHASFENVMNAIASGIPVSKKSLYTLYGLPEPEDEDDTFTREVSQGMPGQNDGVLNNWLFSDEESKKKVLKKTPMIILKKQ